MEEKEIGQRIDDAVNEIPLESILQESKDKLEEKLQRYDENRKKKKNGSNWRLKAARLRRSKYSKEDLFVFGIEAGILIVCSIFAYQFIIKNLFN